mgnify:CR=1 FL=1
MLIAAATAPVLYVAGCANNVYPCSGTNRQAQNPLTGAFLGPNSALAIGTIVPGTGSSTNGVFANGQMLYADETASYIFINANLVDTDKKANLTEERMSKLTAIKFSDLPLNLAVKRVKGKGTRKLAYFGDPNCGYCKRFERDLQKVDNITVYLFLYPILGQDSVDKSRNIWCAKDRAKAWQDAMLREQPAASANCDTSALQRNVELGRKMLSESGLSIISAVGLTDAAKQAVAAVNG